MPGQELPDRMKVVWVSLTFAADASPFDWLVDHVDLTMCGPSLFDRGAPGGPALCVSIRTTDGG